MKSEIKLKVTVFLTCSHLEQTCKREVTLLAQTGGVLPRQRAGVFAKGTLGAASPFKARKRARWRPTLGRRAIIRLNHSDSSGSDVGENILVNPY